jgi:hypothetical protein
VLANGPTDGCGSLHHQDAVELREEDMDGEAVMVCASDPPPGAVVSILSPIIVLFSVLRLEIEHRSAQA